MRGNGGGKVFERLTTPGNLIKRLGSRRRMPEEISIWGTLAHQLGHRSKARTEIVQAIVVRVRHGREERGENPRSRQKVNGSQPPGGCIWRSGVGTEVGAAVTVPIDFECRSSKSNGALEIAGSHGETPAFLCAPPPTVVRCWPFLPFSI